MKAFASLVAAAGLLLAADGADGPKKTDAEKLQGTWTVVGARAGGRDVAEDQLPIQGITFDGDVYTNIVNGKPADSGAFHLDATQQPAMIDLVGPQGKTVTQGIYQLDGDTLQMAIASVDENRPAALVSKPGSGTVVLTLKRAKK